MDESEKKKPIKRIAVEYIQVGNLWMDARQRIQTGTEIGDPNNPIKEFVVLSASHDTRLGYGVLIVVHKDRMEERDTRTNENPSLEAVRFIASTHRLMRKAVENTLFGATKHGHKKGKGRNDADPTDSQPDKPASPDGPDSKPE